MYEFKTTMYIGDFSNEVPVPYSRKFSRGSIFADGRSCNILRFNFRNVSMYERAYFTGLIFAVH